MPAHFLLWFELFQLQERYICALDNGNLDLWTDLFVDDCFYEIVPRENADAGLPIGLIHCDNKRMLRDQATSLRDANVYGAHQYRHLTSGLSVTAIGPDSATMSANYVIIQTLADGESHIYQAGRYHDVVVRTPDGWRYRTKRAVYDTLRIRTLLATPV